MLFLGKTGKTVRPYTIKAHFKPFSGLTFCLT
nr:MAG TPA: zinc binding domain protein [Caudoviricetes sp.]